MSFSRRGFLRGASGALGFLGAAAAMNKVLGGAAFAATLDGYTGYRALVAVFLLGGNDGNNLLVPLGSNGSTGPYDRYLQARPNIGLDVAAGELLPVSPVDLAPGSYGVHHKMPLLHGLFQDGKAAFICNVGPLVLPLRKTDYTGNLVQKPEDLFSHSHQQDAWASAVANPSAVFNASSPSGWGGRTADRIAPVQAGTYPEVVLLGGKALFGNGVQRAPLSIGVRAEAGVDPTGNVAFEDLRDAALADIFGMTGGLLPAQAYGTIMDDAVVNTEIRNAARDAAWDALPLATRQAINTAFGSPASNGGYPRAPDGSLASQLYEVIREIIAGATRTASGGLGLRRQLFSVGLGGFDTHAAQRYQQDALLDALDGAIGAFQAAIEHLEAAATAGGANGPLAGLAPQATLFTMSDFGRTLRENAGGGTDHGWGNHVIVVGSRVRGNRLFGAYPNLNLANGAAGNSDTVDAHGRWIPTLSVEQVANSLAFWLGATTAEDRAHMFPNLDAFVDAAIAGGFPGHTQKHRVAVMKAD